MERWDRARYHLFGSRVFCGAQVIQSGDKANHIPSLHIPQLYYFVAFSSLLGWPIVISREGGTPRLVQDVWSRMFGNKW